MASSVKRLTTDSSGATKDHIATGSSREGSCTGWIPVRSECVVDLLAFFALLCCVLVAGGGETEGQIENSPVIFPQGSGAGPAGTETPAPPVWPVPVKVWFGPISFVPCLGFVVNRRERQPGHPVRAGVCETIRENPGVALVELSHLTGMNRGTLKYHLHALGMGGEIVAITRNGRLRFFPNNGMYSGRDKVVFYYLRNPASRQILLLLHRSPGMCRKEIADQIGVSGPTVSWHTQRLHADGVIEELREGRKVRYYLSAHVIPLIRDSTADLPFT